MSPAALLSPRGPNKSPLVFNVNQQFIMKRIEGDVIQNVGGTVNLDPGAQELLCLIDQYGQDQAVGLTSAVHELEDPDAPVAKRRTAKKLLAKFVNRIGDSVQGVATELLTRYLETKVGI